MKKILLAALLLSLALSCKKNYNWIRMPDRGWAPPPPGYVEIPGQVRERFSKYNGILYDEAFIFINDSSQKGRFCVSNTTNDSYPSDSSEYKKKVINVNAKTYFDSIFYDQKRNTQLLQAYNLIIDLQFRVEPGEKYRKTMTIIYSLNDSLFH